MAQKLEIPVLLYKKIENGTDEPDLDTLVKIADILNCPLDELFGRRKREESDASYIPGTGFSYISEKPCAYGDDNQTKARKVFAIGEQSFRHLREKKAYYVDKTQMIEEFWNSWYQITLVTRPRRFGKSLNLSMLAEFLDCTRKSAELFAGTKISKTCLMKEMNRHPVIFLSFLNVKGDSAAELLAQLRAVIYYEYERYYFLLKDERLPEPFKKSFQYIFEHIWPVNQQDEAAGNIIQSLSVLCRTLEAYYGRRVFLFLDEYDTPFISANSGGYYEEVRGILSGMLISSLKGNSSLEKAMLTGVQRVAKENIFSGLNNLVVCTMKDPEYGECFGFTEEEVRKLLECVQEPFTDDIRKMYDGYRIGNCHIYNPWSVTMYAARKKLESYWVNTSENSILKKALAEQGKSFESSYRELICQESVIVCAELSNAYYENPAESSLWGLLINAGLVTIEEELKEDFFKIRIPNQEVWKAFRELTFSYIGMDESCLTALLDALQNADFDSFASEYQKLLMELPSYYDLQNENSYHMMMLGMCAALRQRYEVKSNRESGEGRPDLILLARGNGCHSIILEFKYTKDPKEDLEALAEKGICQIRKKKYGIELPEPVYSICLAHCGKKAAVKWMEK